MFNTIKSNNPSSNYFSPNFTRVDLLATNVLNSTSMGGIFDVNCNSNNNNQTSSSLAHRHCQNKHDDVLAGIKDPPISWIYAKGLGLEKINIFELVYTKWDGNEVHLLKTLKDDIVAAYWNLDILIRKLKYGTEDTFRLRTLKKQCI
ncbi:MAG: hypothetical protein LBI81_01775 [Puniceicoccales bacterium]|jgi:hypothetical protein|nr:hypothetical protein [Puniceicoccales bacterium]